MADEGYGDDDAFYFDDDDYLYVEDDYAIAVSPPPSTLQFERASSQSRPETGSWRSRQAACLSHVAV